MNSRHHASSFTQFHLLLLLGVVLARPAGGATITWINTAGGAWTSATNWSPNQVPGSADTVLTASGTYAIILNTSAQVAALTLGSTSGTQTLSVAGSTLTVTTGGTVSANGILTLSSATLTGNVVVNGTMNWQGGTVSGGSAVTIAAGAVLNISGNSTAYLEGALTNAGTVNWTSTAGLDMYNYGGFDGAIVNQAGALFNARTDETMASEGGNPYFSNAGTFLKSAGTNTAIGPVFNNAGTINVANGTVTLSGGGVDSGMITGPGSVTVPSGTLALSGTVPNLLLTGGTVTGFNVIITNLTWNSGGVLQGTNMTVAGLANWTSGTLGGEASLTIASNAVLNISGSSSEPIEGMLTNLGTINWSGTGNLDMYYYGADDGAIINQAGALFNVQNDETMTADGGNPYFSNAGTFLKSAGANTTINVPFSNTGLINVTSGTVTISGGGVDSGTITGPGSVTVPTGTLALNGAIPNLLLTGGTVTGFNVIITNLTWNSGGVLQGTNTTVTGLANWTGGTLGGESSLTIASNAVLNISANSYVAVEGMLTNLGTLNWSGTGNLDMYYYAAEDGAIINQPGALFNVQNDETMAADGGNPYFSNAGTFLKSAGTNTTIGVVFNNPGLINVASGTVTIGGGGVDSGTITGPGSVTVPTGTLAMSGTIPNLLLTGGTVTGFNVIITNLTWNSGGVLQGTNTTVAVLANWTGGTLGGEASLTIASNAVLNISGSASKPIEGMLTNAGTVNWSGTGNLNMYYYAGDDGAIINQPGALFNAQTDETIASDGGNPYFTNAGTFLKSAGTNTTISAVFNNSGRLNVATGTVTLSGGGVDTGTITGPGSVTVPNGTLALSGAVPNLLLTGGTITGFNVIITNLTWNSGGVLQGTNMTVAGLANWTSGTLGGEASLTIASNAVLNISGSSSEPIEGMLTNLGTVNWSGTGNLNMYYYAGNDGAIINQPGAFFNVQNDETIAGDGGTPYFVNAGTLLKSAGTNTTISTLFTNTGTLGLTIYSRSNYGRINFSGSLPLAGVVTVNATNTYSPATGDSFTLLTYASETGVFSAVNLASPTAFWQTNAVTYGSTAFTLSVGSLYKLVFAAAPPATNIAGVTFPAVVAQAEYQNGAALPTNGVPVTIALTNGSGSLSGTLTRNTDASGKATFNDLSINLVGPKILYVASPPWITPTNGTVTIIFAPPAKLLITKPIAALQKLGYPFSPAPVVQVLDQFGNIVSNATVRVMANSTASGGGSLGGATAVTANGTNGLATFGSLHYSLGNPRAAETVTVYYTSPGLAPATNAPCQVDFVYGLITLTNNNAVVQIDPNTQDGMYDWNVDGVNQLFQHWFWVGEGANGPQYSLDQLGTPLGTSWTGGSATINYQTTNLNVTLSLTLQGGAPGSQAATLLETLAVQNAGGSSTNLHVYDYSDFDLAGTNEGDTVAFPTNNMAVQQGKDMTATQTIQGPKPSFWQASWYAFTLDTLNDTSPPVLDDEILPNEPGDQTFAWQWDTNLVAGQTLVLNVTNTIQSAAVRLTITRSGASVIISWPASGTGSLKLQSTLSLGSASVWSGVTNSPVTVGPSQQVTLLITGTAQYFRLH